MLLVPGTSGARRGGVTHEARARPWLPLDADAGAGAAGVLRGRGCAVRRLATRSLLCATTHRPKHSSARVISAGVRFSSSPGVSAAVQGACSAARVALDCCGGRGGAINSRTRALCAGGGRPGPGFTHSHSRKSGAAGRQARQAGGGGRAAGARARARAPYAAAPRGPRKTSQSDLTTYRVFYMETTGCAIKNPQKCH